MGTSHQETPQWRERTARKMAALYYRERGAATNLEKTCAAIEAGNYNPDSAAGVLVKSIIAIMNEGGIG